MYYPDQITITRKPAFAQDASGNFKPVGEAVDFTFECRGEPAGSNPVVRGDDGNMVEYSWIVYMNRTNIVFKFGDKVKLTKEDGSEYESTLKRQYNGRFNSRLWV